MHTHAQKQFSTQKRETSSTASLFDSSSKSESLQRKADMVYNASQRAEAPRPNNTGMPDNLKSGIESLSGFSMDDVRVHYNSSKPATVQALAYTQGIDIHVAPGQEKCLPHEAWHVAQQMAGRVSPTTNINGMPVNDNAALEHEADVMGEKAVQCKEIGKKSYVDKQYTKYLVQRYKFQNNEFKKFKELREWIQKHLNLIKDTDLKFLLEFPNLTAYDELDISNVKETKELKNLLPSTISSGDFVFSSDKTAGAYDEKHFEDFSELQKGYNYYCFLANKIFLLKQSISGNDQIKEKFFITKNINTIIGKIFDYNTGAALGRAVFQLGTLDLKDDDINKFLLTIKNCICETLEDIEHWRDTKKTLQEIEVTDSDLHCRGIGVCIITYSDNSKYVIKPEDKSLEQAIYGSNSPSNQNSGIKSLAETFKNIGTLDIQTNKEHGSLVQYFEHDDLAHIGHEKAEKETDKQSIHDVLRFISILGLRDLHVENLVYSKKARFRNRKMQMIDAESALDFRVDSGTSNPFPFTLETETSDAKPSITPAMFENFKNEKINEAEYKKCINLLEAAKEKLKNKKTRLIIIGTQDLICEYRWGAYANTFEEFQKLYEKKYFERINTYLKRLMGESYNKSCLKDNSNLLKETYDFLKSGRIPYYEYDFNSGEIYQKITESKHIDIYQSESLKLENVIERRKMVLSIAYLEQSKEQKKTEIDKLKYRLSLFDEEKKLSDLIKQKETELDFIKRIPRDIDPDEEIGLTDLVLSNISYLEQFVNTLKQLRILLMEENL